MDLTKLSITQASGFLQKGDITSGELTDAHLEKISNLDPQLNTFITVTADAAKQQAKEADQVLGRYRTSGGAKPGALCGIPIALKDLYETRGIRTTAGSKFFADFIPKANAKVVDKLFDAGTVLLGKLNMHEIALGVTTVNPHFGACRNPRSLDRIVGGSSGGSAAALVAGLCMGSLGSDTGGSIRIPASLCGCVGLKPTFGRVSVRGVIPLSWNLDHAGPMARNVMDAALLFQTIAGYDPLDPTSVDRPTDDYCSSIASGVEGWKIGLAKDDFFSEKTDPGVVKAIGEAARVFQNLGAHIFDVDFSDAREASGANGIMTVSDAAAFHEERIKKHPGKFGKDVRERLQMGVAVTSTQYIKARRTQSVLRHKFIRFFENYDLLLTPTTPVPAPLIVGPNAVEQASLLTRFTAPFNLTGLPAISIPCGFTANSLPMGLQIIGPLWSESRILRAAYAYERIAQ
ncbi:MAG: amidase [Proteobacteria bacterium]|nr:amidase [Pseudomonadota bacterium]MBU4469706.1 amidase [Pseudomonadota bacterium]MCG2751788.1 amidase [Desulfobacteraceae bacterium]